MEEVKSRTFILFNAEVKFRAQSLSMDPNPDRVRVSLVIEDHPQYELLETAVKEMLIEGGITDKTTAYWSTPLREAKMHSGSFVDMRDYLTITFYESSCPMGLGPNLYVPAKEHLWAGILVDVNLRLTASFVEPPFQKTGVHMVSAIATGFSHAGGIPKSIQPIFEARQSRLRR